MMKHPQVFAGWMVGLALVLTAGFVTPSFAQDAKAPGPYHVSLQTPDLITQFEQVELTATVTDSQGRPVNGVPVVFSVESDWQANAKVLPRRVTAQDGVANTYFRSNMPGQVTVTAQAGGASDSEEITVSGAGSAPHLSRNQAQYRRDPWGY
jgi:hypothetical protein